MTAGLNSRPFVYNLAVLVCIACEVSLASAPPTGVSENAQNWLICKLVYYKSTYDSVIVAVS